MILKRCLDYLNLKTKTVRYLKQMKLTQKLIDQIQEAMLHTKKDGTVNWKDGDEIEVNLAGTFAADRFIVIKIKT